MSGPTLGYWDIRGLAQPIRLMLKYCNVTFQEKRYPYGPAPDYSREAWLKEKNTLGLDFPNLPYFLDAETKLTQSLAITRYLAHKIHLMPTPTSLHERARVEVIEQQIVDFRSNFTRMAYSPDFKKLKEEYLKSLPDILKQFSTFLGEDEWFGTNERVTYVDFMMYEVLDQHKLFHPPCLDDFQNLKDFVKRVEDLPSIKKYMESDDFIKYRLNGDMAYFGSRSHPIEKEAIAAAEAKP